MFARKIFMNLFKLYFSREGELSRLPFFLSYLGLMFGYGVFLGIMMFMFMVVIGFGIAGGGNTGTALGIIALAFIAIPVVLIVIYSSAVITVKRLHDLGLSGVHVIWIFGLNLLTGLTSLFDNVFFQIFTLLMALAQIGIALWLLFTPGVQNNSTLVETFR